MKKLILASALFLLATACFAESTVSKPKDVELTIYNQNFALVKEAREMNLDNGINYISVQDVASLIEPETVAFKSKTAPDSVIVREQNYQYDLIEPISILNKSVGKKIRIRRIVDGKADDVVGILLNPATVSLSDNMRYDSRHPVFQYSGLVVKTDKGVVLFGTNASDSDNIKNIEVLELPEGLVSSPTLVWKLESNKPGKHNTEISYLTNKITWKADYVAVADASDKFIDITGWVTLDNNSGATYQNAKLNLMAGDVNRIQDDEVEVFGGGGYGGGAFRKAAEPQFQEKSFFEYHLYTLNGRTTVKDRETKQITLMSANRVPAQKTYIYDGRKAWWNIYRYNTDYRPGESYDVSQNKKVNVFLEAKNSKENNLGIPLPKGIVRVYKKEGDDNQHFAGEDQIDHTPKDEMIRLYLGDAFDIVGEHTRTNFKRISSNEVEESFQISVRNHKDTPASVVIIEHLSADWKITQSSHKYNKKDASTVEIPVEVPKDGEVTVTYTTRTKW